MDNPISSIEFKVEPTDHQRLSLLCGPFDDHIRQIERHFRVQLSFRDDKFRLLGLTEQLPLVQQLVHQLYAETANPAGKLVPLTAEQVHLAMSGIDHPATLIQVDEQAQEVSIKTKKGMIKGRNPNQSRYVANVLTHDVTFGIGPAGTGKTYLAVACAVDALEKNQVRRIVLTRPAVEAGEKLGFLPGDLKEKIDPYLRPIYDALDDMIPAEKLKFYLENRTIEIAPLAYMRGRTLNKAFILLDEAQNTTSMQMKMFLTRMGIQSKTIITGDKSQVDLPKNQTSGLADAERILAGIEGIAFVELDASDVVRHRLVRAIIEAYGKQSK